MAKKKAKSPKSRKPAPFEKSLEELELVMRELENGELTLDDSLKKYEAGMKYLQDCYAALQHAESKIQQLVDIDGSGNAVLEPFVHDATVSESAPDPDEDEDDFSDEDPNEGSLF